MKTNSIAVKDIRNRIDSASFKRGERYFRNGHISATRRQGDALKALCHGSRPTPYQVQATLGPAGIVSADCSCPIGAGGYCKHVAALLLTWVHNPETFVETEELETLLALRSKVELITLIQRMVTRYPDLETWIEIAPITGKPITPIAPESIRQQVDQAFFGLEPYQWDAAYGISTDLDTLLDLATPYIENNAYDNAAIIYEQIMEGVLENYGMIHEDTGELHMVVDRCIGGLGVCLEATTDPTVRLDRLRALFNVYRWDIDFGGIDMGHEACDIILEYATPTERQEIIRWIEQALPPDDGWSRRAYGGFLLDLQEEELDDEAYLHICRQTHRWPDMTDRLLERGRISEATDVARGMSDYELLRLAEIFTSHNQDNVVETLIRERDQDNLDSRLTAWLKQHVLKRGDLEEALALTETIFWQRPGVTPYQELHDLAERVGRWDELRAAILQKLTERGNVNQLIEIYLDEGEIDEALELLETSESSKSMLRWHPSTLQIRVAEAAEASRPREAIWLYMKTVEYLIGVRGRGNYASAAGYLVRVRDTFRRLQETDVWKQLIADLRERYRRLPALQDELNQAGL